MRPSAANWLTRTGTQYPGGVGHFAAIDKPWPAHLDTAHAYTLGIEEEFQIVDPVSRELKSHIEEIIEGGTGSAFSVAAAPQMPQPPGSILRSSECRRERRPRSPDAIDSSCTIRMAI